LRARARQAAAALLALAGCAGGGEAARRDSEALRAELRALRQANDELAHQVEALSGRVEVISTRLVRGSTPPVKDDAEKAPVIPPDLAVVRMEPRAAAPRTGRTPPPLPTAVPIAQPDAERLEGLSRRPGRDLAAEAEGELEKARSRAGIERAQALVEFVSRYPRHPSADNALVEAAAASADAGRDSGACELARRAAADYPAGDAVSDALERLAWCESRRGERDAERRLLERLVNDFPRTPAAQRAGARLATISGRTGGTPEGPARSGP